MKWITPEEAKKKGSVRAPEVQTITCYDGGHFATMYRVLTPLEAALLELVRSTGQFSETLRALEEADYY